LEMIDNQEVFDDIVLSELNDKELTEQMSEDLYDGLAEEIAEGTQILLDRGWEATDIMDEALVKGMVVVGDDFRDGILFVPEVLMAANAMKAGMALLEPILTASGIEPIAKMVIGTVKGDIHDIGKNLVGMMMEGAGIEVFNLGINTDAEEFINALEEHNATILGMSALLTTTMPYMKVVIDELKEKGIRDKYTVLVGGAPLNEEFADAVGADAYCMDAGTAVETAKRFISAAS
jgi:methylmalonyl-CoA mutase cobalamin-binding domain/chain